jgi:hypothetical protein
MAVALVPRMMMRALACLLLICASTAACDGDDDGHDPDFPIGLDRVRDLAIVARLEPGVGSATETLHVRVGGDAICIAAGGDFAVTLPGATATRLDRGDTVRDLCGLAVDGPQAILELSDAARTAPAFLTVSDEYKSVRIDLGDLLLPRQATLVAPTDGALHSGQAYEVAWAPALGLTTARALANADPDDLSQPSIDLGPTLDAAASRVTGTAPAFADDRDDVTLRASIEGSRSAPCEGAACSVVGRWYGRFPIALRRD